MEHILSHFKDQTCLYCRKELDKKGWGSHWGDQDIHHYKSIHCEHCKRKNWIRVTFHGSGHDRLFVKENRSLESTVTPSDGRGKF